MRKGRWVNFWVPGALALLSAAILSDVVTDEWTRRQALGWITIGIGWPAAMFSCVPAVGFACGLVGYDPIEQTFLFGRGWDAGMRVAGRIRQ